MSFLETHSNGAFKPQSGFSTNDALRQQTDINANKAQMQATHREAVSHPPVSPNGMNAMLLGNKPGLPPTSGKTNASFHAQSSGRTDEPDSEGELLPFGQFMTRHTTLPWHNQGQGQNAPLLNTLNFLS